MYINYNLWKDVLVKPAETFKKQEKKADLGEGVKHIGIAGIITGFIVGLAAAAGLTVAGSMFGLSTFGAAAGIGAFLISLILTPIVAVIMWLIWSGVLYIFAMIFGGKGSYTTQSYLIAIYTAPLMIITGIIGLIPVAGGAINFLIGLYSLYLLTLALKQAHKVTTERAVIIWLIPVIIVAIALGAWMWTVASAMHGLSAYPGYP
ncbi:MAG: YIP1 family protein [Candidatus Aenigmarchaeota archaeon]|nr:YIP1 family protein [Candidatus Aenigmarchaeota archaeon]